MERKESKGTILTVEEGAMADWNKENNAERAILTFIFNTDENGEEDEVLSFLLPLVQRPKTLIFDLASLDGRNYAEKLKLAREHLEKKVTTFTTYTAQISELNDDGKTAVTNGTRNYTTYSRSYLGKHNDEKAVFDILRAQLKDDIDNGDVEWVD